MLHIWEPPVDISTHGPHDRRADVGDDGGGGHLLSGRAARSGIFHLEILQSSPRMKRSRAFPEERAAWLPLRLSWLAIEVMALGIFGTKAWASIYFTPPSANALPIQAQAGQFAFYFRYPGPDGTFGPIHPEQINEATENFFGLDTTHDQDSKDDIVTAELAVPVNREIHLLMHSKDVGHSFFVRELRIQQDFVPGLDLSVHFTPTKIGRYEIVCTQLCGLGHYNMKAYLEVMSQEDFDKWLKQQAALQ